ncbi:MAG: hypothetical protein MI864_01950 [Pseudomonadales bacterium]|nr:hypothetical protein [Pseudomonadales bacterium]
MKWYLGIPVILFSQAVSANNPDVTSREYKLMLDINNFEFNTEASAVASFMTVFESAVETAISRDVTGTLSLDKERTVKFFDTQYSCELSNSGYSFRERIEDGDSEVTLKFRSPDRYIAWFEDVTSNTSGAETKFEADIGSNSAIPFKTVYSHSTKAPNTRTINNFEDIHSHFPEFEDEYGFSDSTSLTQVGNLTIEERVYKGTTIDLGSFDADVSLTLWYNGTPSGSQTPVVAEISFKYEDSNASYSRKVVNRAKTAFEAIQNLTTWTDPNSKTKTRFVYDYDTNFCD